MIIPALLTDNLRVAKERLDSASSMTPQMHIDLIDNTLIQAPPTLTLADLQTIAFAQTELDIHCMVSDPLQYLVDDLPIERLIIHYELPNWMHTYDTLLSRGYDVWLAVSPETS